MEFYRGKTVLVTGHTGFKGGWLVLWLQELGARVAGLSLPAAEGGRSFFREAGIDRETSSHFGDLRDPETAARVLEEVRPQIVFHLAAQSLVGCSYRDPVGTFATNVMGTVHLLEAVRRVESVQVVVVVTSDKCYRNREWEWPYREIDRLGGRDPYSASKACAELAASAYRSSFFPHDGRVHLATARAGNVIGGGDWGEARLVPDIARAVLEGRALEMRSPASVRPWQHVFGPLEGYLRLGERLGTGGSPYAEAWNFGPPEDSAVTVLELAQLIRACWPEVRWEVRPNPMAEALQLQVSSCKARARLGWTSRLSLQEAVRLTVEWYRSYALDPGAIEAVTRRQLRETIALCRDSASSSGELEPAGPGRP